MITKSVVLYWVFAVWLKCHFLSWYDSSGPTIYYSLSWSLCRLLCSSNLKIRKVSKVGSYCINENCVSGHKIYIFVGRMRSLTAMRKISYLSPWVPKTFLTNQQYRIYTCFSVPGITQTALQIQTSVVMTEPRMNTIQTAGDSSVLISAVFQMSKVLFAGNWL